MTPLRALVLAAALLVVSGCAVFRAVPERDSGNGARRLGAADLLTQAQDSVARNDFGTATTRLESLITTYPDHPETASALFQLAVLYWNPDTPDYDPAAALGKLRQLVDHHPTSPWAPAASAVLSLAGDKANLERALNELRAQLDELKRLDLGPRG